MDPVQTFKASIKPSGQGRLHGKIAIVTGGASSIGRAISLAYAREGASLVIADLRPTSRDPSEAALATHDLINEAGGTASFQELDISKGASFDSVVEGTVQKHGRLDVLVNNAGVAPTHLQGSECPIWESTDRAWDLTMSVNATGVYNGTRAASRVMVKQDPKPAGDRGWIVNLASIYGVVGLGGVGAYVASKHACMGITKSAALDCAPFGIHVNAICPGWIKTSLTSHVWEGEANVVDKITGQHPFRGLGTAEDVAPIAVFLASEDARWVTGTGVGVDGGYTCQ